MRSDWLGLLRCPDDRASPLILRPTTTGVGGEVEEGALECPSCHRIFPIRCGIPALLPRELAEAERESSGTSTGALLDEERRATGAGDRIVERDMLRQMRARDEEAEAYDRRYGARGFRFEVETCVTRLAVEPGERVLDVGCGTGRITREFLQEARLVVGADTSLESLKFLARRVPAPLRGRLFLVRCAAGHLPFPDGAFDAAAATNLFSNLPTHESRRAGLAEIHRTLAARGRALITVYHHCWMKRVRHRLGLARSGAKAGHQTAGRISYYNFGREEFVSWLAPWFIAGERFGLNHRVPVLSSVSHDLAHGLDRLFFRSSVAQRIFAKEIGTLARRV